MKNTLKLIPLIAAAAMVIPTGSAQARGENEITRQAHNIERVAREIKNEFQTHYKRSSAYRHLMADINDVLVKADHIDKLSHDPRTSYSHIKTDLAALDKLSRHLHDVIDAVAAGRYSGYVEDGLGHVHGKMTSLNNAIHSMERAIVAYSRPVDSGCAHSSGSSYQPARPVYGEWESGLRSFFGISSGNSGHGHGH